MKIIVDYPYQEGKEVCEKCKQEVSNANPSNLPVVGEKEKVRYYKGSSFYAGRHYLFSHKDGVWRKVNANESQFTLPNNGQSGVFEV